MEIIRLFNSHFELKVCPSLGGSILAFNWLSHPKQVMPILRDSTNATSIFNTSCYPLVPFSNRIKDAKFVWQGQEYNIKPNLLPETSALHGQGWQGNWQVIEQTDTKLAIEFTSNEADWPFPYVAQQTFEINEQGLIHTINLQNLSDDEMPAGIGFHPFFVRTPNATMQLKLKEMWAIDEFCLPTKLVNLPHNFSEEPVRVNDTLLDNAFTGFTGEAEVILPELNSKILIESDSNCKFAVIYTPANEDFFCIEPVSHCTNAINLAAQGIRQTGVYNLAPNKRFKTTMKLTPSIIAGC